MPAAPFPERERIDARDKVLGATAYSADIQLPGLLYAMMTPATTPKGRVETVAIEDAMRVRGVVAGVIMA